MRVLVSSALLLLAAAPACAGGAEEFFLGRPPAIGVVRGGAFGPDGSDYLDEARGHPMAPARAVRTARLARRAGHAQQIRPAEAAAPVARPYFRP